VNLLVDVAAGAEVVRLNKDAKANLEEQKVLK
jgi:hypothetical protein